MKHTHKKREGKNTDKAGSFFCLQKFGAYFFYLNGGACTFTRQVGGWASFFKSHHF